MAEKVNMPSQKKEKKKKRKKKLPSDFYDYNLLACTILLVSFGLIMLYSASAYEAASTFKGNDMYYFTHQAGLSAIVLVGIVILSKFVDYHSVWFQRIAALVYKDMCSAQKNIKNQSTWNIWRDERNPERDGGTSFRRIRDPYGRDDP